MFESTASVCLMLVLMLRNYNTLEDRSFKQWTSILDISTRWGFSSIRDLAVRCIKPPNSLNRLLLARKHGVEHWVLPALLELCQRPEPLGLEEARLMDFEDVVLVGSVRQTVRSPTLAVRSVEIRNCIRSWKRGEPWSPVLDSENVSLRLSDMTPSPKPPSPSPSPELQSFDPPKPPSSVIPPLGGFYVVDPASEIHFGGIPKKKKGRSRP